MVIFYDELNNPDWAKKMRKKTKHYIEVQKPDHIIAISEFTKSELIKLFPHYHDKITVIPHGADHLCTITKDSQVLINNNRPFFLALGTVERRKNISRLIDAFEKLISRGYDCDLIIAGGTGFDAETDLKRIENSKIKSKIKYLGKITESEKANLIISCLALCYVSLYEGFGFPILEGMMAKVPVITSNIGAMDEISGKFAIKVDPFSPNSISDGLEKVILLSDSDKNMITSLAFDYASQFTWHKTALKTLEVYKKVAGTF